MPAPAKRPDPTDNSPVIETFLAALTSRATAFAPGSVIGGGIYLQTGRLWHALALACVIGAPTKAMQKLAAQ